MIPGPRRSSPKRRRRWLCGGRRGVRPSSRTHIRRRERAAHRHDQCRRNSACELIRLAKEHELCSYTDKEREQFGALVYGECAAASFFVRSSTCMARRRCASWRPWVSLNPIDAAPARGRARAHRQGVGSRFYREVQQGDVQQILQEYVHAAARRRGRGQDRDGRLLDHACREGAQGDLLIAGRGRRERSVQSAAQEQSGVPDGPLGADA